MSLASRLKETRLRRGISMAEAARRLGVAHSAYRMWELGVSRPDFHRWRAISKWVGVPSVTLLREEGLFSPAEAATAVAIEGKLAAALSIDEERGLAELDGAEHVGFLEALVWRKVDQGVVSREEAEDAVRKLRKVMTVLRIQGESRGRSKRASSGRGRR